MTTDTAKLTGLHEVMQPSARPPGDLVRVTPKDIDVAQILVASGAFGSLRIGDIEFGSASVEEVDVQGASTGIHSGNASLEEVHAEIRDITVAVHLKVDLPNITPFDEDIDITPRFRLGTPGLTINLGNVTVPLLTGINLAVQDATVRNLQAQLAPVRNLDLGAGNFSDVKVEGVKLPTGGFSLFGLELGALALGAFGVPAAATRSVAVGSFNPQGPLTLPATEVTGIKLPETNVPEAMSTGAVTLQAIRVGPVPLVTTDDIPGPVDLNVSVEITLNMTIGKMVIRDLGLSITIDRLALKNLRVPVSVKGVTVADVGLEQVRANQISV